MIRLAKILANVYQSAYMHITKRFIDSADNTILIMSMGRSLSSDIAEKANRNANNLHTII